MALAEQTGNKNESQQAWITLWTTDKWEKSLLAGLVLSSKWKSEEGGWKVEAGPGEGEGFKDVRRKILKLMVEVLEDGEAFSSHVLKAEHRRGSCSS